MSAGGFEVLQTLRLLSVGTSNPKPHSIHECSCPSRFRSSHEKGATRYGELRNRDTTPWSSLRAHLAGRDDALVTVVPLIERLGFITARDRHRARGRSAGAIARRGNHRPLGADTFVTRLEQAMNRKLPGQKPGRRAVQMEAGNLFDAAEQAPQLRQYVRCHRNCGSSVYPSPTTALHRAPNDFSCAVGTSQALASAWGWECRYWTSLSMSADSR